MEIPTPEPTPARPVSFDDIPAKRRKYQLKPVGSKTEIMGGNESPASASTRAPTTTGTPSTESSTPSPMIPDPPALVAETPKVKKTRARKPKKVASRMIPHPPAPVAETPKPKKTRARKPKKAAIPDDKSTVPVPLPEESAVELPEAEVKALSQ